MKKNNMEWKQSKVGRRSCTKKENKTKTTTGKSRLAGGIPNLQIGCLTRVILFVCNFGVLIRVPFKPTGAFEKTDFHCQQQGRAGWQVVFQICKSAA